MVLITYVAVSVSGPLKLGMRSYTQEIDRQIQIIIS